MFTVAQTPLDAGILVKHLTMAGLKAIPVVGDMINEVIFGTLDAQDAATASAQLSDTLKTIQASQTQAEAEQQNQQKLLVEITTQLQQQSAFSGQAQAFVAQLSAVFQHPDRAVVSPDVAKAMQSVLDKHKPDLQAVAAEVPQSSDEVAAYIGKLSQTVTQVKVSTTKLGITQEIMLDRVDLILMLGDLDAVELDQLITCFPSFSQYDIAHGVTGARIAALVGWADSRRGAGLPKLYSTGVRLKLFPTTA